MKRIIADRHLISKDDNYLTYTRSGKKFGVHVWNGDDPMRVRIQVSEIHPYDDAEYTWAKYQNLVVEFIRDGSVKDRMHMHDYDTDYYETVDEYVNDIIDSIAVELIDMNKDVKPRMIHN